MSTQQKATLERFYDMLDEYEEGDAIAQLAEDIDLDMMFPSFGDVPPERFRGGKQDFINFMNLFQSRGSRFTRSGDLRRHNIDTLVVVDGLELMVGRGLGGRRNGTILSAAQGDADGKLRRYAFVMSDQVPLSPLAERQANPQRVIERFFDRLDGISFEDPLDVLAEDFRFEMVFPGFDGAPDERTFGTKQDFAAFMTAHLARRPRQHVTQQERRHHIRTSTLADGLQIVVGKALNGRRNGTIIAVAEPDGAGLMRRFVVAMAPAVDFPDP